MTGAPVGACAVLDRIARTNADFAECAGANAMPSMLAKQAEELHAVSADVAMLIDELAKSTKIIAHALNCLSGHSRDTFVRTLKRDGLDGIGCTRYHERVTLLDRVAGNRA